MIPTTLARYVQPVTHGNLLKLKMIFLALWSPCLFRHIHSPAHKLLWGRLIQSVNPNHSFSSVSRYLTASFCEILISFLWSFRTMRDIDAMARRGTETGDDMNNMMQDSIEQIKVLALLPVFPVSRSRLSRTHIPTWVIAIGTPVVVIDFLVYSTQ